MKCVRGLVKRSSDEECTFAIVSAKVPDDFAGSLLRGISKAYTSWVEETDEGKESHRRAEPA